MTHYHEQREDEMKKRVERIEELRKQRDELTKEIEQLEAVKVWEPEGGEYAVNIDGIVIHQDFPSCVSKFGIGRKTKALAFKAHDKMRVFNRLLAYVDEFAPDYEFEYENDNCCIYYDNDDNEFKFDIFMQLQYLGTVYMPRQVAIDLCKKLNSGEVVL